MAGRITITDPKIRDCGIGISIDGDPSDFNVIRPDIERCQIAIRQRNQIGALTALGIPPDIPAEYVLEVLKAIGSVPLDNTQEKEKVVKSSRLWGVVQNSANAATILQTLTTAGAAFVAGLSGLF